MILHIANPSTFIGPFIKLIKEEFCESDHRFWLVGSIDKHTIEDSDAVLIYNNTFWGKLRAYAKLLLLLHSANKVMLHGLFNIRLIMILALCPWLLTRCYWIIWGGDLYQYLHANSSIRARIKEPIRKFVLRRIGHLVTYIKGDVDLARKWYKARGVHHECLMYLSNVSETPNIPNFPMENKKPDLYILVGNSADPSNNHIEVLGRLLPYKEYSIKIFVPLSYGDQTHAKKVISQGREWFGDKFVPMTSFMPLKLYLEFLESLDIAIFNHQRQQAMGNIITLLGMGKTIFIRNDVSHWRFLKGLGIKLNDVANLTLQPIDSEVAKENARIVQSHFSKAMLTKQLSDIFEE